MATKEEKAAEAKKLDAARRVACTANCIQFHAHATSIGDIPPLASPVPIKPLEGQAAQFLGTLFPDGDRVCIASNFSKQAVFPAPNPPKDFRALFRGVYFKINSLLPDVPAPQYTCGKHCGFKHVLLEMDATSMPAQTSFWTAAIALGFPVVSLVDSGGKSLHALLRVHATCQDEYKGQVMALQRLMIKVGADTQTTDNGRFSRLPGYYRAAVKNNQTLVYLNPDAEVWCRELPCNGVLEDLFLTLPDPPGGSKQVKLRERNPETDKVADGKFRKWVEKNKEVLSGKLDLWGFLLDAGFLIGDPVHKEDGEDQYYTQCLWCDEHTGGGQLDGPKDAYFYMRSTGAAFPWGYHCSHDTCQRNGRTVVQAFDVLIRDLRPLLEAHTTPLDDGFECEGADEVGQADDPDTPAPDGEPEVVSTGILTRPPSQIDHANTFAVKAGKMFRYVKDEDVWLKNTGGVWKDDIRDTHRAYLQKLIQDIAKRGSDPELQARIRDSITSSSIQSILFLAQTIGKFPSTSKDYDKDPLHVACANGVINLNTRVKDGAPASLEPYSDQHLIRSSSPYNYVPGALCPRWTAFVEQIFPDAPEMWEFFQRLAGYCATGLTQEDVVAMLIGDGCNGKSTCVYVLGKVLGDYAGVAHSSLLLASRKEDPGAPNPALFAVKGKRLAVLSETGEDADISEVKLKEATKGEEQAGRNLFKTMETFMAQYKLLFSSNHRPTIKGTDKGIWRRILYITFDADFSKDPEKDLKKTLLEEGEGILAWIIEGAQKYLKDKKDGLKVPKKVRDATKAYREEEDVLLPFYRENFDPMPEDSKARVSREDVYNRYLDWMSTGGRHKLELLTLCKLGIRMRRHGFKDVTVNGYSVWRDFNLTPATKDYSLK